MKKPLAAWSSTERATALQALTLLRPASSTQVPALVEPHRR